MRYRHPAVRTAHHRRDGDHDHLNQDVAPVDRTALVFQMYRTLQAQGLGGDGNHALVKALEHLAGFEIGKVE